jgi:hypothetical protein
LSQTLIAEDNRTQAVALRCIREAAGLEVEEAAAGGEALRRSARNPGLTRAEAENLLDWLEANGRRQPELGYEEGMGFVVHWR